MVFLGVDGLRYTLDDSNFLASSAYFTLINGLTNITQLSNYAPTFISLPHFLHFSSLVSEFGLIGMPTADQSSDASFIDVHQDSGLVMNSARRLQYNVWTPRLNFSGTSLSYNLWQSNTTDFNAEYDVLYPAVIQERRFQLNSQWVSYFNNLAVRIGWAGWMVIGW